MKDIKEKDFYKQKIIELVKMIENQSDLKMIYGVAMAAYKDVEKKKAEEG